ncbi:MAG: AAA family ATPase [Acidobacteriota bacterium]|nr:AAA family ATPase [Acidobacteriota bacterium]
MNLKLPIGIDDFKKVIQRDYHYVDKSMFIVEVMEASAETLMVTRPRRSGKTINMSMLHNFFDESRPENAALFVGLAVQQSHLWDHRGRYPVIFLTFKDLKSLTCEGFIDLFAAMIAREYRARKYLLDSLDEWDAEDFQAVAREQCNEAKLMNSLAMLTEYLAKHHESKVILLIDEYDSPIHTGYANGYYKQIALFMRGILGKVLKENPVLEKAVLTGILRVARESIFSDLNHVDVATVLNHSFSDKFGFTEAETAALLEQAGLGDKRQEVSDWYNGYKVGETTIYNPWSILNYIDKHQEGFRPYWVNTSSNELIREQLLHAPSEALDGVQEYLQGNERDDFTLNVSDHCSLLVRID